MTDKPVEQVELRVLGGWHKFIDFECPEYDPDNHEHTVERTWVWIDQAQRLVASAGLKLEREGRADTHQYTFDAEQHLLLKKGLATVGRNFEAVAKMARA